MCLPGRPFQFVFAYQSRGARAWYVVRREIFLTRKEIRERRRPGSDLLRTEMAALNLNWEPAVIRLGSSTVTEKLARGVVVDKLSLRRWWRCSSVPGSLSREVCMRNDLVDTIRCGLVSSV